MSATAIMQIITATMKTTVSAVTAGKIATAASAKDMTNTATANQKMKPNPCLRRLSYGST